MRKPLNNASYDTKKFHSKKEAYVAEFEEHYKAARHKLGAHVQDYDFAQRLELWNEIELIKVSYFVDGAIEIYKSLAKLKVPGYVAYVDPPELADLGVIQIVSLYLRTLESREGVEIGSDSLAMTRNNTTAMLNIHQIHARAGQLVLIRRWMAMQRDLMEKFAAYPRIARILKASLITEIVSFCDCLVTRPVPPGALQEMDGLDKLIKDIGGSPDIIDSFVRISNFNAELTNARAIRDTIGAHLEIDDAQPLHTLTTNLDNYDIEQGLDFYDRVSAVFTKTCLNTWPLRPHAIDGVRVHGVTASEANAVPYSPNDATGLPAPPARPLLDDEEEYRKNLMRWLDGNQDQRESACNFFRNALMGSQQIATLLEVERIGSGERRSQHEYRKAHEFLLTTLASDLSDSDFQGIVELAISCRGGHPYPLAQVM
ncbi:MAG: hypothetical protein ACRECH_17645, partial [Nitrososphaerales archaeon]